MDDVVITLKIEVEANLTSLAKEVYKNYPEYSTGCCMRCTGWQYGDKPDKPFLFTFVDDEEGDTYEVNLKKAEAGVAILLQSWIDKKYHFYGIKELNDLIDPCNWDQEVLDAALQCAVFGKIIYG